MALPSAASKANCDSSTDDPKLAILTDLAGLIDKFNLLLPEVQPVDALLTALAAQTTAANKVQAYSGADTPTLLTTGTASGNIPLVGTKSATESLAGLAELATQAEANAGTDDTVVMTSQKTAQAKIVLGTLTASTSGVAIDFTGIPAYAKKITVLFNLLSTNGSSIPIVQLGDAGGIEATGYTGGGAYGQNSQLWAVAAQTTGFPIIGAHNAPNTYSGIAVLQLMDASTNMWAFSANVFNQTATSAVCHGIGSGTKSLTAALDRIRMTTVNGTDAFDAGSINVSWE